MTALEAVEQALESEICLTQGDGQDFIDTLEKLGFTIVPIKQED